jgi:hypothetical protein
MNIPIPELLVLFPEGYTMLSHPQKTTFTPLNIDIGLVQPKIAVIGRVIRNSKSLMGRLEAVGLSCQPHTKTDFISSSMLEPEPNPKPCTISISISSSSSILIIHFVPHSEITKQA